MGIDVKYRQGKGGRDGGRITWLWLWLWIMDNGCSTSDMSDRTKEKSIESSKSPGGDGGGYRINT